MNDIQFTLGEKKTSVTIGCQAAIVFSGLLEGLREWCYWKGSGPKDSGDHGDESGKYGSGIELVPEQMESGGLYGQHSNLTQYINHIIQYNKYIYTI